MDILLVRHGQSVGNAEQRMQGQQDFPLSPLGTEQAQRLAAWLRSRALSWQAAYVSPLSRARETYHIVQAANGGNDAEIIEDLSEISAGKLEGLNVSEIAEKHPVFFERSLTELADYAAFGGESYEHVQARVDRLLANWIARHRNAEATILAVSHGGLLFQLVKAAVCVPVPRVAILKFGNCTVTKLHFQERRGRYMAEVSWHVPVELMG